MWGNRHARARRSTAVATLAIAGLGLMAVFAPAAVAHPNLTDEQKTCLEEAGIEKPAKDENGERVKPTEEQRTAFRAAAEACGIELPARPNRPRLTDEQKACLEEAGIEKPAKDENGERVKPTEEQRTAFRAAAEACGIELPDRPPEGDAPADAPAGDDAESSTQNS